MQPKKNLPPKDPQHILEEPDEDQTHNSEKVPGPSTTTKPRAQNSKGPKKSKSKPTVVELSDSEDSDHNDKNKEHTADRDDSDIEEIKKPMESPEEEVGKLYHNGITILQSLTIIF